MLVLPWHLSDRLTGGIGVTLPADAVVVEGEPGREGRPWADLVGVYAGLVDAVAREEGGVTVLSGDCVSAIAVLAGLQCQGLDPAVVWFDAHGDFHTEATTTSGYLGGLPLAKVVGLGDLTLPEGLGMSPIAQHRAVLVDARDLDPPEVVALADSKVRHLAVTDLTPDALPVGPILLHVDLDVLDPRDVHGFRFPAPGGPPLDAVAAAIGVVAASGRLAALNIAATWRPDDTDPAQTDRALTALLTAAAADRDGR
jgi:arginase